MIENSKTNLVEEEETEEGGHSALALAGLAIGVIIFLMIICLIMIFVYENL